MRKSSSDAKNDLIFPVPSFQGPVRILDFFKIYGLVAKNRKVKTAALSGPLVS